MGVLAFILAFQKPPFESRLSAINKQYFIPDDHSYSADYLAFLERCFTTDPTHRPSAAETREELAGMLAKKRLQVNLPLDR